MLETGFYFVKEDGGYERFDARLTKFVQNSKLPIVPDALDFVASKEVPMPDLAEIIYVVDGVHKFHGIATNRIDNGLTWSVSCKSMEWLLDYRYIPEYIYHNSNLNTVFSSDVPGIVVGALFLINSLIPNGKWEYYSATVAKLAGAGQKSCFGTKTLYAFTSYPNAGSVDGCDGVHLLSAAASLPPAANQYYRDVDDLYVRLGDGSYRENAFLVAAVDWADTKIRFRSIDIGSQSASIDFSLEGQASASLEDFFMKIARELQFLPMEDGYVHFRAAAEISRGTETEPIKWFVDGQNATVLLTSQKEPNFQAAIGLSSNDPANVPVLVENYDKRRIQLFKIISSQNLSKSDTQTTLQRVIDSTDDAYKVKCSEADYALLVGDWIGLRKDDMADITLRIRQIEITPAGMVLVCGKELVTASQKLGEYLRPAIDERYQPLQSTELTNGAGTFTKNTAVGLAVYYEETFTIPVDDTQAALGAFVDITLNGKIIPPGRIKLINNSSIKINITDYCSAGSNTISRNLYNGTGWTSASSTVKQYKTLTMIA